MTLDPVQSRYKDGTYLSENPDWDSEDSPWKASIIANILRRNKVNPKSIVEVGCGAGFVLNELNTILNKNDCKYTGYDIAVGLNHFWEQASSENVTFYQGDFLDLNKEIFDVALVIDVIEHVSDPHSFLTSLKGHANHVVLHIPLDLSVLSLIRERPLLHVRNKVGHIHYFTKSLALMLLNECGYKVQDVQFTGAGYRPNGLSLKSRLMGCIRYLAKKSLGDLGVRIFGGETLIVLASTK